MFIELKKALSTPSAWPRAKVDDRTALRNRSVRPVPVERRARHRDGAGRTADPPARVHPAGPPGDPAARDRLRHHQSQRELLY